MYFLMQLSCVINTRLDWTAHVVSYSDKKYTELWLPYYIHALMYRRAHTSTAMLKVIWYKCEHSCEEQRMLSYGTYLHNSHMRSCIKERMSVYYSDKTYT